MARPWLRLADATRGESNETGGEEQGGEGTPLPALPRIDAELMKRLGRKKVRTQADLNVLSPSERREVLTSCGAPTASSLPPRPFLSGTLRLSLTPARANAYNYANSSVDKHNVRFMSVRRHLNFCFLPCVVLVGHLLSGFCLLWAVWVLSSVPVRWHVRCGLRMLHTRVELQ